MPAYWIARSRVIDASRYWKYAEAVPGIIARHGGKALARGGNYQVMEGARTYTRFVVLEFPSMEAAVACFESPEYQAARENRLHGAGEAEVVIVDGGEFTSAANIGSAASGA